MLQRNKSIVKIHEKIQNIIADILYLKELI